MLGQVMEGVCEVRGLLGMSLPPKHANFDEGPRHQLAKLSPLLLYCIPIGHHLQ